ncbi:hypothetical protein TWF718_009775 [Orbilia javanica]|uniref:Uncharacterized protein n=1 Tax=Orbilia javanica TaxID=47235 RepID=A0AAN8RLN8_9PEZI
MSSTRSSTPTHSTMDESPDGSPLPDDDSDDGDSTSTTASDIAKKKMERHTKLLRIIDTAPEGDVRLVLKIVCKSSEVVEEAVRLFERIGGDRCGVVPPGGLRDKGVEGVGREGKCVRCGEVYELGGEDGDEDEGGEGCWYHWGNRHVDIESEVWEGMAMEIVGGCGDWEGYEEGVLEEFAEGFRWDCCDEDGTVEGCVWGRHVGHA